MSSPQPTFQFSLRTLFVLTAIASFLLAGYVLWNHAMKQFFHDVLVGETGPVESRSDWPDPLARWSKRRMDWRSTSPQFECIACAKGSTLSMCGGWTLRLAHSSTSGTAGNSRRSRIPIGRYWKAVVVFRALPRLRGGLPRTMAVHLSSSVHKRLPERRGTAFWSRWTRDVTRYSFITGSTSSGAAWSYSVKLSKATHAWEPIYR